MRTEPRPEAILRFLGGARSVTGSRFLVEARGARVLVDCGLYQGVRELRRRNWEPFPVDPATIDAVVLTHAHVDHSGYLPALQRLGFRGRVLATRGTCELCSILLPDAAMLQEEEASFATRKHYSKHDPALPLFTRDDAAEVLERFEPVDHGPEIEAAPGVHIGFRAAGHILGSASVLLRVGDGPRVLVSGDLGRPRHPLLRPPDPPAEADALLVESTYGDRNHDGQEAYARFFQTILRTSERGGVVVIPAFAVDRTEVVLWNLREAMETGAVPRLPVYVDSPMALSALGVYRRAIRERWPEIREDLEADGNPLDPGVLHEAHTPDESKAINDVKGPAIVVSASGMATGGRVLHHLTRRLPDPRNAVVLVGYQAAWTRGWRLLRGERLLKMFGRYVPVRAEIVDASGFSVHADRAELLAWLGSAPAEPETTFVVHGELEPAEALRDAIERELDWAAVVPRLGETVRIAARL